MENKELTTTESNFVLDLKSKELAQLIIDNSPIKKAEIMELINQSKKCKKRDGSFYKFRDEQVLSELLAFKKDVLQAKITNQQISFQPNKAFVYLVPYEDKLTLQRGYMFDYFEIMNTGVIKELWIQEISPVDQIAISTDNVRVIKNGIFQKETIITADNLSHISKNPRYIAFVKFDNGNFDYVIMTENDFVKYKKVAKTSVVWDAWPLQMRYKSILRELKAKIKFSLMARGIIFTQEQDLDFNKQEEVVRLKNPEALEPVGE